MKAAKYIALAAALVAACLCAKPAQAHGRHRVEQHHIVPRHVSPHAYFGEARRQHIGGRPAAWCGYWMRFNYGGADPGPTFNLARKWTRIGSALPGPTPGAIGVAPHHVFKVISVLGPGRVLAISGNDGHSVRERERSTRGVIAWRLP